LNTDLIYSSSSKISSAAQTLTFAELVQFAALLNTILDKLKANLGQSGGKSIELRMYLFTVENELHSANDLRVVKVNPMIWVGLQVSAY